MPQLPCTAFVPPPCAAQIIRDKNVIKPAAGTRKCNCRQKVVTHQIGPGMYQQYTTQVRAVPRWRHLACTALCLRQRANCTSLVVAMRGVQLMEGTQHVDAHSAPSSWRPRPTRSACVQVCEDCPAVQLVRESEALSVHVEAGMPDRHTITFFEEGEPIVDGEGAVPLSSLPSQLRAQPRVCSCCKGAGR